MNSSLWLIWKEEGNINNFHESTVMHWENTLGHVASSIILKK